MTYPQIIQAGMGIAVSNYKLANAVAREGQMGVVSGTAIDSVLVRRLQAGDPSGDMRRALKHFPSQEIADRILQKYFSSTPRGYKQSGESTSFTSIPMSTVNLTREQQELFVVANFVEVFLAKEGHSGPIGVNFLEKIQFPVLPSLYGAMLAGADYIIMGAGIPKEIPALLDRLSVHEDVSYKIYVIGASSDDDFRSLFSPQKLMNQTLAPIRRPKFLAVISSTVLAHALTKKSKNPVDGFVIEAPSAGGHNAPPRGKLQLNERGEPIYGPRDEPDFQEIASIGLPFWLAGSRCSREGLQSALQLGAVGIQVGTAFAICEESGLSYDLKTKVIKAINSGTLSVFTDPKASPTGFPFKIAQLENTLAIETKYLERKRCCDLGYLRDAYKKEDGTLGYRCASEPINTFIQKGGSEQDTVGRKCLCNALMADIGLGQWRKDGGEEQPILTMGDDIQSTKQFLTGDSKPYKARDVLARLLK